MLNIEFWMRNICFTANISTSIIDQFVMIEVKTFVRSMLIQSSFFFSELLTQM